MLGFTDSQLAQIEDATRPLDAFVRSAFVAAIGHYFQGRTEIGDGELHRFLIQLQREFLAPPRRTYPRVEVHFKRR